MILKTAQTPKGRFKIQLEKDDTSGNAKPRPCYSVRLYAGKNCTGGVIGYETLKTARRMFLETVKKWKEINGHNYKVIN